MPFQPARLTRSKQAQGIIAQNTMNYPAHLQIGFESKKQPSEDLAVSQAFVRLTELTVLSSRHFGPPSPAPADVRDWLKPKASDGGNIATIKQ